MEASRARLSAAAERRQMRLTRRRLRALACLGVLLGVWVWLSLQPAITSAAVLDGPLNVSTTVLSDGVRFYVRSGRQTLPPATPLRLNLATPAGPYVWHGLSEKAYLELPYVRAGVTPYEVFAGEQRFAGTFSKLPGAPVTPLELNVGPRVARVTGGRAPALVLHPLDAQKNVTLKPVRVNALYPDGAVWERSVNVDKLLAWTLLPTRSRIGKLKVSATTDAKRGERADVDLVPGALKNAQFAAQVNTVSASGRDTWQLELSGAQDALGNQVGDGTAVTFKGKGQSTSTDLDFFLTRPVTQGGQPLALPPYPEAGAYELQLVSDLYASPVLPLTASPLAPERLELRWSPDGNLLLGPVLSQTGALVDDGTQVTLSAHADAKLLSLSLPLQTGELEWPLPPLPPEATELEACVGERCERIALATR